MGSPAHEATIAPSFGRGDDTIRSPRRAQIDQFELFEFILFLKLDKQLPVEPFEATVSQSTVASPPSQSWCGNRGAPETSTAILAITNIMIILIIMIVMIIMMLIIQLIVMLVITIVVIIIIIMIVLMTVNMILVIVIMILISPRPLLGPPDALHAGARARLRVP